MSNDYTVSERTANALYSSTFLDFRVCGDGQVKGAKFRFLSRCCCCSTLQTWFLACSERHLH